MILKTSDSTSKMATERCVYMGWLYENGDFQAIMLVGCYGGGGEYGSDNDNGGYPPHVGSGGGSRVNSTANTLVIPPSCESFNFTSKKGANWQEALVKNVHFKVFLLNEKGVEILHVIDFPQPIAFGTPLNVKVGNTNITPGIAANTSARALQRAMQDVIDRYGHTRESELTVRLYFEERLKHNYPLYIYGGRVNFNATNNGRVTDYKTNSIAGGDCR
jgi:hypothetical protein